MLWVANNVIGEKICTKGGEYILALKGNQGDLHDDVKTHLQDCEIIQHLPLHTTHDKGHGRLESRTCYVSFDVEWLVARHPKWSSIECLIRLDSMREIKGKKSVETRYYSRISFHLRNFCYILSLCPMDTLLS